MKMVRLGDICRVVSGSTPQRIKSEYWNGHIPWVTPKELSKLTTPYLDDSLEKITELGYKSCSTEMLPARSLLLSSRAPIGLLAINTKSVCTNQGFKNLVPSKQVNIEYLYFCLKSNIQQLQAKGNGATFKELSKSSVEDFTIPLPPLDDQIRIANLLSKVGRLISQRKQHLKQLDELLKSVFLEMFGDPVRNERGWDRPELKHFGKISTGNTPPRKDASNYSTKHIEWIKTDNITSDSMYITSAMEYLSVSGKKKGRVITDGALLVACIAGSVESIGRAALANRTVTFNQQINAIQPNEDVSPAYLYALFKISKAYIQNHASKGMKRILTKGDFEKITMIKPPFDLQEEFAAVVEKIEGIKVRYQASLAELERLYGVLSQRAFKGELDLSRIPFTPELASTEASENAEQSKADDMQHSYGLPSLSKLLEESSRHSEQNEPYDFSQKFQSYVDEIVNKSSLDPHFNNYLDTLKGKEFKLEDCANFIEDQLVGLDPEYPYFVSLRQYETEYKDMIFRALADGRLQQIYDETDKRIILLKGNG